MDTDMELMHPITSDFTNEEENPRRKKHTLTRTEGPGKPAVGSSQLDRNYWNKGFAGTQSATAEQRLVYPVGPPYLATVADMHRIAGK
jgi:hypothetical protein